MHPLSGIRVLDLSRVLAGPICAQNLGDLGADVIKVERPGHGDDTRSWGPPFQNGEAAYFMSTNRNKRSLTLNYKCTEGLNILGKLIKSCDVVIENFKLGTLDKWGFDAKWFENEASSTIRCSITGYGSKGPKSKLPGYDFLAQAESGLMSICGSIEGEPIKFGISIVDFCTGQYATIAILAALQARAATGRGQNIEANLYSTALAMLVNVGTSHLMTGKPAKRLGNGHPNAVPYREFKCADKQIALPIGNDQQFAKLCKAVNHPEWIDDSRLAKMPARVENRELVDSLLEKVFVTRTADEWIEILKALGIPAAPIQSVESALSDPHTQALGMIRSIEHSETGPIKVINVPYVLSETPAEISVPPPQLGEHNKEILSEILEYDSNEIEKLSKEGVI